MSWVILFFLLVEKNAENKSLKFIQEEFVEFETCLSASTMDGVLIIRNMFIYVFLKLTLKNAISGNLFIIISLYSQSQNYVVLISSRLNK